MSKHHSIGIFTYSTRPRGSVVHAAALAEALLAEGQEVTLYALAKDGDRFYRELTCPTVLFPAALAADDPQALIAQRVEEMARGIRQLAPTHDVYHAQDCLAASALLASGPAFAPLARTVHHVERFTNPYLSECQRRSVLWADAVLTVSSLARRDVERHFGERSTVVANGVDCARFSRRSSARLAAQARALSQDPEARFVLSVGGIEPRKNSLVALQAMTSVLSRLPHAHWLLAGGSSIWEHADYRAEFERELSALPQRIRSRIHRLGTVGEDELTSLYQLSRVLLHPSAQEGFGLCVLEALAAGTPVVVSDAEPFTEYLDRESASLVDWNSPDEIAGAVMDLLLDAGLVAERVRAGTRVAECFSWSRVARAHLDVYAKLVTLSRSRESAARLDPRAASPSP